MVVSSVSVLLLKFHTPSPSPSPPPPPSPLQSMILPPTKSYQRPALPLDEDLAPTYQPPPPPTPCERFADCLHRYHRMYTAVMFLGCIALLLWGGMHGINVRPASNSSI